MITKNIGGLTKVIVMITKVIEGVAIFADIMGNGIGTVVGIIESSAWLVHCQQIFRFANVPNLNFQNDLKGSKFSFPMLGTFDFLTAF
ncbi:MAG: hypothetical protein WCP85_08895 [Mariniphaga sp.]